MRVAREGIPFIVASDALAIATIVLASRTGWPWLWALAVLLVVIAACVILWLKDRPAARARLPAGHVREQDRHDNRRV